VMWHLGEIECAFELGREAVDIAETLRHPLSIGIALAYTGLVFGLTGKMAELKELSLRLIEVSERYRLTAFRAQGEAYLGWTEIDSGLAQDGIAHLEGALSTLEGAGWSLTRPAYLTLLAAGYSQIGRYERAHQICANAKEVMIEGGERWFEAELHRIEAEATKHIVHDPYRKAERAYLRGVAAARQLHSPTFLLRNLLGLANYLPSGSRRDEVVEEIRRVVTTLPATNNSRDVVSSLALIAPAASYFQEAQGAITSIIKT